MSAVSPHLAPEAAAMPPAAAAPEPPTGPKFVPGDERAREAGRRSGEVRRQRAEAERAAEAEARTLAQRFLDLGLQPGDLAPAARAAASLVIERIATNHFPIRTADEAASVALKLQQLAAIEQQQGQVPASSGGQGPTLQTPDADRRAALEIVRDQRVSDLGSSESGQVSGPSPPPVPTPPPSG